MVGFALISVSFSLFSSLFFTFTRFRFTCNELIDICVTEHTIVFPYQPRRITTFDIDYNNNNTLANTLIHLSVSQAYIHTHLSHSSSFIRNTICRCYQVWDMHNTGVLINGMTIRSGTVHHVVFIDVNLASFPSLSLLTIYLI